MIPPDIDESALLNAETIFVIKDADISADEKIFDTKSSINLVLSRYFFNHSIEPAAVTITDSFYFIFNNDQFATWHTTDWWEQRKIMRNLKADNSYADRTAVLLEKTAFARYYNIPALQVGYSDDPQIHYAWMQKRLFLEEVYWNALDSVSFAAYHKKYQGMHPAIGVVLCHINGNDAAPREFVLVADNGAGRDFKKTSKESAAMRLLHGLWKIIYRKGAFNLGGLGLGLLETYGELHCFGSGAVTTQLPFATYMQNCP